MGVLAILIYLNYTISRYRAQKVEQGVQKMNTTQLEFDTLIQEMKENEPNLYQILFDFLHKKLSLDELNDFLSLEGEERWAYIDSYKAR